MQWHPTADDNNQKQRNLPAFMHTCIPRCCVNGRGGPWLSLSATLLQREPSHLLY